MSTRFLFQQQQRSLSLEPAAILAAGRCARNAFPKSAAEIGSAAELVGSPVNLLGPPTLSAAELVGSPVNLLGPPTLSAAELVGSP
eukprot:CAMPEP_0179005258 /NCGR_PEP_ID=MMETSP0795-20121207/13807_1 /TAXON_ID=88552 /ORGANISM="Amoebophrya sp., Strain Ameob2" /LENGTH=85 /DNA_ID=CAMNT_0020699705 /DNA_START=341 /DNA_END=596 /DNA_ORIENTATION=-